MGPEVGDDAGEGGAGEQREDDEFVAQPWFHPVDEDVDANMDAGADAVGSAEFGHPHEHDDAEFLGPAKVEFKQPILDHGDGITGGVAMDDGDKYDQDSATHEEGDEHFLKMIEKFQHACNLREKK